MVKSRTIKEQEELLFNKFNATKIDVAEFYSHLDEYMCRATDVEIYKNMSPCKLIFNFTEMKFPDEYFYAFYKIPCDNKVALHFAHFSEMFAFIVSRDGKNVYASAPLNGSEFVSHSEFRKMEDEIFCCEKNARLYWDDFMTRLQLAEKFFTDFFGAVCFYNDPQDGYVEISDGHRKIETLSVYFPNKIDLHDEATTIRLTNARGEKFYESYVGARDLTVCGVQGSRILACFYYDGKIIGMHNFSGVGLKGNIDIICDYFCGRDLCNLNDGVVKSQHNVATNNGRKFEKGMKLKEIVDDYVNDFGIDDLNDGDNHYVEPTYKCENFTLVDRRLINKTINGCFGEEFKAIGDIAKSRSETFGKLYGFLTEEEWAKFYADWDMKYPPEVTREDD